MHIQLPNSAPRRAERAPLHKVVTRHNGLLFHATVIASFLESTVPLHANALAVLPAFDPEARRWLERDWAAGKAARGQRLRAYVEQTWEGFDWGCGYAEFYEAYRPRAAHAYAMRPPAAVALSLCAAAAQTAALYRGLARYADDPELRATMRDAAAEEACGFDRFRVLFERMDRARSMSAIEAYRTVVRGAQDARDGAVRLAFESISRNWCERAPFPEMTYALLLERAGGVLQRFVPLDVVQRALFRPWFKAPEVALVEAPLARRDARAPSSPVPLAAAV